MLGMKIKKLAVAIGALSIGTAWADWNIVDLGTLGGNESIATSVNNNGDVVGYSSLATGETHAFLYNGNGINDLGSLGGNYSGATSINNNGDIVGFSNLTTNGLLHAFLYSSGSSTMVDIAPTRDYVVANAINDNGRIVGTTSAFGSFRGFNYNGGSFQVLGTFGGAGSEAFGVNNSSAIVGQADTSNISGYTGYHAYVYSGGVMTDIHSGTAIFNRANDINASGTVVGYHWSVSGNSSTPQLAFMYSAGVLTDLGTLSGATDSVARAINVNGDIVGQSGGHAFVYSGGTMTDLNSVLPAGSGWLVRDAYDINDDGLVVGYGVINGENHAFAMAPGC